MNRSGMRVKLKALPFGAIDWALVREVRKLQGEVGDMKRRLAKLESR